MTNIKDVPVEAIDEGATEVIVEKPSILARTKSFFRTNAVKIGAGVLTATVAVVAAHHAVLNTHSEQIEDLTYELDQLSDDDLRLAIEDADADDPVDPDSTES